MFYIQLKKSFTNWTLSLERSYRIQLKIVGIAEMKTSYWWTCSVLRALCLWKCFCRNRYKCLSTNLSANCLSFWRPMVKSRIIHLNDNFVFVYVVFSKTWNSLWFILCIIDIVNALEIDLFNWNTISPIHAHILQYYLNLHDILGLSLFHKTWM